METIKNLLVRFRPSGTLFLIGILLIIYIAFGFLYLQQGAKQKELEEQITKLSLVLARPLPSDEELQTEYEKVNRALLIPKTDQDAIAMLVSIAEEDGIDVDPGAGKFRVPPARVSQAQVGGGNYQLFSFGNVHVQGDPDNVMAFISDLDSGKTRKTMVLKRVVISQTEIMFTGEEGERRAEFRKVASAVRNMMDAGLSEIPNPMSYSGGVATNLMGDDPDTEEVVEGFPDITTTAAERGYTGDGSPRDGYVLYGHDEISTDNTSEFETVNYINKLTTKYYYTCEADGTVWQFDGADVATATGYWSSEESKIETVVTMDVDIYIKAEE